MKKIAVLFSVIVLCLGINAYAAEYANIPACKVTLNGQEVDNTYRQYPLLQHYKDTLIYTISESYGINEPIKVNLLKR